MTTEPQRTCPSCGNDKLKPIGNGRTTAVYEFVPARFIRHEHVQEVLRCGCGDYVPYEELFWLETGQCLADYFRQLQEEYLRVHGEPPPRPHV